MSKLNPIYYNITLNTPYTPDNDYNNVPANIEQLNNQVIVNDPHNYYVAITRATIPTNVIPLWICPVQIGQPDINLTPYIITFTYRDPAGNVLVNTPLYVQFISEVLKPNPQGIDEWSYPMPPVVSQDISGFYYYVYDIETILNMFNNTLKSCYQAFVAQVLATTGDILSDNYPVLIIRKADNKFILNIPKLAFDQSITGVNRAELYFDSSSIDLLGISGKYVPKQQRGAYITQIWRADCFDLYDNTITFPTVPTPADEYYAMFATQSNVNIWGGFSKIVFTLNTGFTTKLEYDEVPSEFQKSNNQYVSVSKPQISMLTDIEVDRDSWAFNSNVVQFQSSSISQCRLVSIISNAPIQNFQIAVYWVDTFGNRRPLNVRPTIPLTIKLGFFPKSTLLI